MTPQEALQIVNTASAQAPLSRQEHITVQQAVDVIRAALADGDKDS